MHHCTYLREAKQARVYIIPKGSMVSVSRMAVSSKLLLWSERISPEPIGEDNEVGASTRTSQSNECLKLTGRYESDHLRGKAKYHYKSQRVSKARQLEVMLSNPQGKRRDGVLYFLSNKMGSNCGSTSQ